VQIGHHGKIGHAGALADGEVVVLQMRIEDAEEIIDPLAEKIITCGSADGVKVRMKR
jgi:hypothetical protein